MNRIVGFLAVVLFLIVAAPVHTPAETSDAAPGYQTSGLAFDEKFVYATELSGTRTIFVLDPDTGEIVRTFKAPASGPSDIVADGLGSLFISDLGKPGDGMLYEVDATDYRTLNAFPLPFRGGALAYDGTHVYVGDLDTDQVLVMDREGEQVRAFHTGLRPAGMVYDWDLKLLWVISELDEKISQVTLDGQVLRTCAGPREPGSQGLGAITMIGPDLYIAEAVDPERREVTGTIYAVDPSALECNPPLD